MPFNRSKQAFTPWLALALAVTAMSGLIFLAVQQSLRQTANDPQIQLSEDISHALAGGLAPTEVVSGRPIDMRNSLATFAIAYDAEGKVKVSTAMLDGNTPALPSGVFDYAKKHGQDRITWEPAAGVRTASIVTYYNSGGNTGYVLAGRNLREVEDRENQTWYSVAAGWALTMVVIGFLFYTTPRIDVEKNQK